MTRVIKYSFGVNLAVLKMLCLYIPGKYTRWHKIRAYIIFLLFMLHVPILGTLYFALGENVDMKRVSDNGFVLSEMCCYVTKLLPFVTKAEQIKTCIHYFETRSFTKIRNNQKTIIEASSKICRRNSLVFIISLTGGFLLWATKPFMLSEYRLPIDIWLPINISNEFKLYYSIYFWVVLGVGYPAVASAAVEPLVAGLASMAAAHFGVLRDNLENLYEYSDEECKRHYKGQFASQHRFKIIFKTIQKCIKHHYEILEFVKLYQDCFSQVVFSQFAGSIFVLGFCCLQLSMLEPLSANFWFTLGYLGVLLAQIFFYCYYGSSLFEQSNKLTNSAYMGRWYEYDVKSRKALIMLMERAKRPVIVTAGKILDLSLVTFTTILRRSYSLLAVLRN